MTPTTAGLPHVDYRQLFHLLPTGYLVMTPDFVVVDANDAYLASVGQRREDIVGRPVFEAFPPSDDALDDTGVSRVQRSFERARDTGRLDAMPVQRYDIPDLVHGGTVERFWSLISLPVPDRDGRTALVVQRAEDVTDFVRERQRTEADRERGREWRRRIDEVEADLFARAQEVQAALRDRDLAARQLASLAHVALLLTSASSLSEVEQIVVGQGLKVLGADGGAIVTPHPDGGWQVSLNAVPGTVMGAYGPLPFDDPQPGCWVARTGQRLILPTRESGLRFHPVMAATYEVTQRLGWAVLPLRVGERLIGSLAVAWEDEHDPAADELELLDGFASQLALALERIWATEAQQAAAAEAQQLSETLQRSFLTQPRRSDTLEIAVRYQPAAAKAHIGGDWYDAFATSSGGTVLVVGDVNGHDRTAAALMGQLRNLVRGMAYDNDDSPAELLTRLDRAMRGLGLDTLATAVLARVEDADADAPVGAHRLHWSNAGHPPPVLRTRDGEVRVLEPDGVADLLLGWDPDVVRTETVTDLPPGSTLVLYTDGLVERREAGLDEGIARLVRTVRAAGDAPAEAVADRILRDLGPDSHDDDVALLVLRGTDPA